MASARIAAAISLLSFASARLCAAASASKPSPGNGSVTMVRPERLTAGGLFVHCPCRVEQCVGRHRLEALDIDSDPIVRIEIRKRSGSDVLRPKVHRQVCRHRARDTVVERRRPTVEFVDIDAIGAIFGHELRPIDHVGNGDRPDRDSQPRTGSALAVAVESRV